MMPRLVVLTSKFTVPTITAELDYQTAICRRTTHRSADALENDAAFERREVDPAINVGDRDAAVLRLQRKIGATPGQTLPTVDNLRNFFLTTTTEVLSFFHQLREAP